MSKLPNRIPFEEVGQFTSWIAPSVSGAAVPSAERQRQKQQQPPLPKQPHETIEEVVEPVSHSPLTAQQLQEITEEAAREGFNQGYEEGLQKGLAEGEKRGLEQGKSAAYLEHSQALNAQTEQLAELCQALMAPVQSQAQSLENQLLNLAVFLAQTLLERELTDHPGSYWPLLAAGLNSLPAGAKQLVLYLPPEALAPLSERLRAQGMDWPIHPDPSLAPGAYRLEGEHALVTFDARSKLQQWLDAAASGPTQPAKAPKLTDYSPSITPEPASPQEPAGQSEAPLESTEALLEEEPLAGKEPFAREEPLVEEEPSADKEPSAQKEPSAHKQPSLAEPLTAQAPRQPGDSASAAQSIAPSEQTLATASVPSDSSTPESVQAAEQPHTPEPTLAEQQP